jgi:hypothetical protein
MAKQKLVEVTVGDIAIHVRGEIVPAGGKVKVTEDQETFLRKVGALAPEKPSRTKKKDEEKPTDAE